MVNAGTAELRQWHGVCLTIGMRKLARLFTIKTRFEAYLIIYALALGAMNSPVPQKGTHTPRAMISGIVQTLFGL